jgi:hypothetical protein
MAPADTFTGRSSPAATTVPQIPALMSLDVHRKHEVASPKSKAQETKVDSVAEKKDSPQEEPLSKGWALALVASKDKRTNEQASKPTVKDVESMKGSAERESAHGEGDSTNGQGCLWGGPPARPPRTPDRPLRPPGKGQMGVDWRPW